MCNKFCQRIRWKSNIAVKRFIASVGGKAVDYNMELNVKNVKRKMTVYARYSSNGRNCEFVSANCEFPNLRFQLEYRDHAFLTVYRNRNRAYDYLILYHHLSRVIFLFRAPLLPSLAVDTCKQNSVHPF